MQRGNLSRRGFLQRSSAAMMAMGVPAWFANEVVGAELLAEEKNVKKESPNSRIVMGAIGTGGRGRGIMNNAMGQKGVEMIAACDVDKRHLNQGANQIKNRRKGADVKKYSDFRKLLDNSDIDAVTIGTPDHWHTLIAIDAMRKGKDVYCEKPLTLTVAEGIQLVKVAKETGKILQTGSQQRSEYGGKFRLACELVRNGRIGKLSTIETRIGSNPTSPELPEAEVPEGLDWDFWLGPAPKVPYYYKRNGRRAWTNGHYEFRWWYAYSGGKMTDWGAHHNDIAQWALDMDESGPVMVESEGKQPSKKPNQYNCHENFKVTYTYDNGVKVICTSGGQNGVKFNGENGWIFVSRGKIEASDPKLLKEPLSKDAVRLYHSTNHMGNFMDCVRSRKQPTCNPVVGHRSVTVCHIGAISLRLGGRKLKWDPKKEQFAGDKEANAMLSREMRGEWKLG